MSTNIDMSELLANSSAIALIGVSPHPDQPSYADAAYLQSQGYELVPVTEGDDAVVGYPTVSSLGEVNRGVDLVSIFLQSEQPVSLKEDVQRLGVKAIWVEPGCSNAVKQACAETGLPVFSNHCIMKDHQHYLGGLNH